MQWIDTQIVIYREHVVDPYDSRLDLIVIVNC